MTSRHFHPQLAHPRLCRGDIRVQRVGSFPVDARKIGFHVLNGLDHTQGHRCYAQVQHGQRWTCYAGCTQTVRLDVAGKETIKQQLGTQLLGMRTDQYYPVASIDDSRLFEDS